MSTFCDYLRQKGEPTAFENLSAQELADILKRFYVEARKSNGEMYKRTVMMSFRSGINRHLLAKHIGVDILCDREFKDANAIFEQQKVVLRNIGKGEVGLLHFKNCNNFDIVLIFIAKL